MKKNTRKSKLAVALSIPELKHAWDEIHRSTHTILREGKPAPQQIKEFQKMWKKIFHRPVSTESAESYLNIQRLTSSRRMGKKTRKMKGGGALAGAPLDSSLQPGIYGTHGSFPTYQSSGLGFYDTINKQGMFQECGIKDITPVIGSSVGSNQAGGGVSDILSIAPYSSLTSSKSTVPGTIDDVTTALKGFSLPSSGAPDRTRPM